MAKGNQCDSLVGGGSHHFSSCSCWFLPISEIKNAHENEMKKAASEREILWEILKKELKMEHESAVKNLEQKVNELEFAKKCKEKELESEKAIVEALKKETALYKEAFENINIEIRPKSNNK